MKQFYICGRSPNPFIYGTGPVYVIAVYLGVETGLVSSIGLIITSLIAASISFSYTIAFSSIAAREAEYGKILRGKYKDDKARQISNTLMAVLKSHYTGFYLNCLYSSDISNPPQIFTFS
ncbi:hypothetical protein FHS68_004152 [Dyadobacter arcticus]|uniref:Uncharacterized protein n=1 Tax=Dyadobacter arcticus TaxID=1078754 RepID=A0ABX0UTD2_9BACT|nr:hypothetical protein [Dyadobacter arcticus]